MRELSHVFGHVSASNFEAIMARLAVLYEDLRIELFGIAEDSIPAMDVMDVRYRRIYFLRKSIGTLLEFAEAVRHLHCCPEFVLPTEPTEIKKLWQRSAAFFARNEGKFRSVRNDIGGHFGLEAARYACLNFHPDAVMGIEMTEPFTSRSRVLLNFSGEVVGTAMLRHATGVDNQHKTKRLITLARIGYRHATTCVHCVVFCHLWSRFGK